MAGAAKRYARAAFEIANEEGAVDAWSRQLATVRQVLENPAAQAVLDNPSSAPEVKLRAVGELDLPGIGPGALNLMRMLVVNRRTHLIGEIVDSFEALADTAAGRVRAIVTTAVELPVRDRDSLRSGLSASLGKDVRLESRVDPKILGGLVLQVGDRLTDASVAGRLQQLKARVLVK
ncbi:MAG: F0F1 ATP synthase subunit delta [Candidatus Dormibacteraeota bacterium]|nr:F0F1 ATP synthase subunit delta [Candidatus Dormibacteraeota bacterium]